MLESIADGAAVRERYNLYARIDQLSCQVPLLREAWSYYRATSLPASTAPYHNAVHTGLVLFDSLSYFDNSLQTELSSLSVPYSTDTVNLLRQALGLAAVFHDVYHTLGLQTDEVNISYSVYEFTNFWSRHSQQASWLHAVVCELIRCTRYTEGHHSYPTEAALQALRLKGYYEYIPMFMFCRNCLIDADLSTAFHATPGCSLDDAVRDAFVNLGQVQLIGLHREITEAALSRNPNAATLDFADFLQANTQWVASQDFRTPAAKARLHAFKLSHSSSIVEGEQNV